MADDPRLNELVLVYTVAARQLADELEALLLELDTKRLHRYREILKVLRDLQKKARGWAAKYLEQFFREADERAISSLQTISVSQIDRTFGALNRETVESLIDSLVTSTDKALDSVKSLAQKVLARRAGLDKVLSDEVLREIAKGMALGEGLQQLSPRVQKILTSRFRDGVVSIVGRGGRRYHYPLDYYAALVAHQTMRQAATAATILRAQQNDHDLVRVSENPSTLPWCYCNVYAGKVFSISGRSLKYPALSDTPNSGPPFHPWCRHSISIFREGFYEPEELEEFADVPEEYLLRPGETSHTRILRAYRMSKL